MWNVPRLKRTLKDMRLKTSGTKNNLIQKIVESDGVDRECTLAEWRIVCMSKKTKRNTKRKLISDNNSNEPKRRRNCEGDNYVEQEDV